MGKIWAEEWDIVNANPDDKFKLTYDNTLKVAATINKITLDFLELEKPKLLWINHITNNEPLIKRNGQQPIITMNKRAKLFYNYFKIFKIIINLFIFI